MWVEGLFIGRELVECGLLGCLGVLVLAFV